MARDKTAQQVLDAGLPEMLTAEERARTTSELPREFGQERNKEVIRNRPAPDPHYGNPGPNPVGPLTTAQQDHLFRQAQRSPDPITARSEEELEEDQEQAEKALKEGGISGGGRQTTSGSNRQVTESGGKRDDK